jgi:thymidylate kinase
VIRWDSEAIGLLERAYMSGGVEAVLSAFPGMSRKSVHARISEFGLRAKRDLEKKAAHEAKLVRFTKGFVPVEKRLLNLPWVKTPTDPEYLEIIICSMLNQRAILAEHHAPADVLRYFDSSIAYNEALLERQIAKV